MPSPKVKLPKNEQEFNQMPAPRFTQCTTCGADFSALNTHSPMGWRETQISGNCEDCFDTKFPEETEEN